MPCGTRFRNDADLLRIISVDLLSYVVLKTAACAVALVTHLQFRFLGRQHHFDMIVFKTFFLFLLPFRD